MSKGLSELPKIDAPIADTHAHLDMLDDPPGALERAAMAGLAYVVTITDVTEAPDGTFDLLQSWLDETQNRLDAWGIEGTKAPDVGIVVGAHPHNAKDFDDVAEQQLREFATDERVVAIGEIGLDFHYDHSPRDVQRRVFRSQLEIARESGLPVVVHLRDAQEEGIEILQEAGLPEAGVVIHCFTGNAALAQRFIELGCYVSFAGPVTFKNADAIRAAAAAVPLDKILVETDCPFMAPEPYRGRTNEPAWTVFSAVRIAEARGIAPEELARATYDNARTFFSMQRG